MDRVPDFDPGILQLDERVVFFPVRHHSPAAARALQEVARRMRPAAILIEGPADFNSRLAELALPHKLPIAIYSYVRLAGGQRRGAFYPFCLYSPEWQALHLARELGAEAQFIDLPWADLAAREQAANRYADAALRESGYVERLCRRLGVEDLDALWDTLFEIDPSLSAAEYLARCHHFCFHVRVSDGHVPADDYRREAFMAAQIAAALTRHAGRILVVTGGFHSYALYARLHGLAEDSLGAPPAPTTETTAQTTEQGIALTPYSYERLDSLTGYESGMPNPGFYHQAWQDRQAGVGATHRALLAQAVKELRRRGQTASSADLIAVEAAARGLADLRGHAQVWRLDLLDGILGALVKDEQGSGHPFLQALHEVFRGTARGHLAEGTILPPLVADIRQQMARHDLEWASGERVIRLDLFQPSDLARNRALHQMRVLGLPGYARTGGSDLVKRDDLAQVWEEWRGRWTPEFDAAAIEAALYGATLADAASARLTEQCEGRERDAEAAALALLDAALMGQAHLPSGFLPPLVRLIREDGDFFRLSRALGHLLYLFRYDEALGTAGSGEIAGLLRESFARCLWLLETLGQAGGRDKELLDGVRLLVGVVERAGNDLGLDPEELAVILQRAGADRSQSALLRGAAAGALWTLGRADMERILSDMRECSSPEKIGDFLTGLFHLARETAQRHAALVESLDRVLLGYDADAFLAALPALRLAFSYFAPREKHHMARTLMGTHSADVTVPRTALEVSPELAAQALAFEARVLVTLTKYGLRGGSHD